MKTHTQGPWFVNAGSTNGKRDHQVYSDKDNRTIVAAIVHRDNLPPDEIDANARLIAAAPELLEALDRLVDDLTEAHKDELNEDHYGDDPETCSYCRHITQAKAAIAKAGGAE